MRPLPTHAQAAALMRACPPLPHSRQRDPFRLKDTMADKLIEKKLVVRVYWVCGEELYSLTTAGEELLTYLRGPA